MLLPRRPWLLVFDLDGTLIDSSLDLCLSVNAAMAHVGSPQLPHSLITEFIGDGAAMLIRRALGDPGDLDAAPDSRAEQTTRFERAFNFFLEYYREHKLDNTKLYAGVFEALAAIRSAAPELPMAVLTNKPVRPSQEICDALDLSKFFFANYGGNSFATKKPDPAGLLSVMAEAQQLLQGSTSTPPNLDPSDVVMVGDSEVDVLTARRAGARSVGCLYGLSPHALRLAEPDMLCTSPTEWPILLGLQSDERST